MITLKELVEEQCWNDTSDIEVIKRFFILNDMEEQAIDLISALSKSKVRKLKRKNYMAVEWAKENVSNIKEPETYFQPLIRYLEENGIKFKDRKGR